MKIAISGKGGVGKTTLAAGLARLFAEEGRRVVAIDADPDANLAAALGATAEQDAECVPLSKMDDLIEERTGARPGAGGMFRLDPDVSDVVDVCGMDLGGVVLLKMGTVERGGAGCMCAEGAFLKAFLRHLVVERDDVVILDMEAGIEHLGRGTAESVDILVVVAEPSGRSVQTAQAVRALARDIGLKEVVAVGNRIRGADDVGYLEQALGDVKLLGTLPESDALRRADRDGTHRPDADPAFSDALRRIADRIAARSEPDRQEDAHARHR